MSEVKPNSPNGQGQVYGQQQGGHGHMYGYQYPGQEMYNYGTMPYGYQPNQPPMVQGAQHGCAPACGGGVWSSTGTILVLFILLVIISKTMFI